MDGDTLKPSFYRKILLKTLLIGFDIAIFAAIGYIIGRFYEMEVYGVLIGALIGTAVMYLHYLWFMKRTAIKA